MDLSKKCAKTPVFLFLSRLKGKTNFDESWIQEAVCMPLRLFNRKRIHYFIPPLRLPGLVDSFVLFTWPL